MELYRISSLFLIACILQVGALPSKESQAATREQHHNALAGIGKSFAALKGVYDEATTTLSKLQSCGTGTHLEMLRLAAVKLDDFQGCVNATREIANYEEFGFHLFYYLKLIFSTFIDLGKDVFSCHQQPGFFSILNCTVTEIQNSGPEFDSILTEAKELIAEVEIDTDDLVLYVKRCFGYSSSEFLTEVHSLIKNNC